MREQRLTEHLDCSVKNAVNSAVTGLTVQLHGRMTTWESRMQHQWEVSEKKWEDKTVQLEPGSVEHYYGE